ncbi:hypothetical protein DOTSEDRAFT_42160 [Dothistroma septosporum NZE10]|uniref:F-box domain-containing protein n=1 Tax=Dothistroma septosporum (strain NZE10 / CBS 128990) TaxID=675120 RepID=N1Q029_DOTSN|nr:hypothetical protein DOTSEDRAFT_42160 [Dothistroma septosporum NZE10]
MAASTISTICRAAILLTLPLRLRTLTRTAQWSLIAREAEDCRKVLDVLLEYHHRSSARSDRPLAHLKRLYPFEAIEYDSHPRGGLSVVDTFMALPSLSDLHVSNLMAVDDDNTGSPFE